MNKGQVIAEILNAIASSCLHLDAENESAKIRYGDEDIMNALHIFAHVIGNASIHRMIDAKETKHGKYVSQMKALSAIVKEMTGVDSREYYKKASPPRERG